MKPACTATAGHAVMCRILSLQYVFCDTKDKSLLSFNLKPTLDPHFCVLSDPTIFVQFVILLCVC